MTREITNATASNPTSVGTNQTSRRSSSARSLMTRSRYADRGAKPPGASFRVVDPAHFLPVADRTEADAFQVLGPRPEVLGVVDPDAGGVVHDDARRILVGLLAHLAIGRLQRHVEQLVHLRVLVEARRLERAPLSGMEHLADPVLGIGVVRTDPVHDQVRRGLRLLHALDL